MRLTEGDEVMADRGVQDMTAKIHYRGSIQRDSDWKSEAVRPLSDDPKDMGLYVVTDSYDRFFKPELEKAKNGGPPK